MGSVVDVTAQTFEQEVLEPSFQKPVLVDFFAQWCGPCQMLKPVLEKLAQEYDFVLAKVDIDRNPELARIYQVEGVPDVKVALQGQLHHGFVGMLPEPQLRELLAQLNLQSTFEQELTAIATARANGEVTTVRTSYDVLLATYPDRPELQLEAAQFFLSQGDLARSQALLDAVDPLSRSHGERAATLKALVAFHQQVADMTPTTEADQLYLTAAKAAIAEQYEVAMDAFLQLVKCDRGYRSDAGRKGLLTLFSLLGDDHPLTQTYRKRLMQALY